jgi:hypothetical protein
MLVPKSAAHAGHSPTLPVKDSTDKWIDSWKRTQPAGVAWPVRTVGATPRSSTHFSEELPCGFGLVAA